MRSFRRAANDVLATVVSQAGRRRRRGDADRSATRDDEVGSVGPSPLARPTLLVELRLRGNSRCRGPLAAACLDRAADRE